MNVLSNTLVQNYLTKFPLFGKKHLDYLDWLQILVVFQRGRYRHKEGIELARKIKERRGAIDVLILYGIIYKIFIT